MEGRAGGRAAGVRGAAAGVLGDGLVRADTGAAARRPCCSGSGTGRGGFIRLCRATDQGVALPRQDRWRGKPSHVTSQRFRSSPRQPAAAPPYMTRLAIGATKNVSLKKTVLNLKLVFKKC